MTSVENKNENPSRKLKESFYLRDTLEVAQDLLGKKLVRIDEKGEKLSGLITETEAYLGSKDPACHSYKNKKTPRTECLYLKGGHAYIYFIYGMYYCFNVVTRDEKSPEAVLIRALMPLEGKEIMIKNRFGEKKSLSHFKTLSQLKHSKDLSYLRRKKTKNKNLYFPYEKRSFKNGIQELTNGPGKLSKALNLTKKLNKESLLGTKIYIEHISKKEKLSYLKIDSIGKSARIGLGPSTKEGLHFPFRFFYKKNPFVSKVQNKKI